MKPHRMELAVGVFALVIFAALTYMTFKVGELAIGKKDGYVVHVTFKDTAGLDERTRIKIAGVDAGSIEKIELVEGVAILTLRVDPGIKLYSDARARIKSTGLLGDKYLELSVGSKKPLLKDGDTIRNVEEVVDIEDMIRKVAILSEDVAELLSGLNRSDIKNALSETVLNLRDITSYLDSAFKDNKETFSSILTRIDSLTASLDSLVQTGRHPLINTISNLEEMTASLKTDAPQLVTDLGEAVNELKLFMSTNREGFEELLNTSNSMVDSMNMVARKIERGEGTIGKLVHDEKLYDSLSNTVSVVGNAVSAIERFRTYLTFKGEYYPRLQDAKGSFYLTISPRPDKSYILGVISDPLGRVETVERLINGTPEITQEVREEIEFTAQYARRFKDTVLRAGVTESTFGVGLDQYFIDDRLKFYIDAWDFGNKEFLAKNPHVNIGVDYFLFKNLFISGGLDNVLNSNHFGGFVGTGLTFEDEDLKYLFGSVPSLR